MKEIFRKQASFIIGATQVSQLPLDDIPEVCFIGRSNVGKSSVINFLTNNTKLARVSKTPGCTQQINFFDLGKRLRLVDLPGYGYAKASKMKVRNWNQLIYDYLRGRPQLLRVFILVDSRHGTMAPDLEVLKFLESYGVSCQIILTKVDQLNAVELKNSIHNVSKVIEKYANCMPEIVPISSFRKIGLDTLQESIILTLNQ